MTGWFTRIGLVVVLALGLAPPVWAAASAPVVLQYKEIELKDGRKLADVVVKTYDPSTKMLLLLVAGTAMIVPIDSLKSPLDELLKSAPLSGANVSMINQVAQPRASQPADTAQEQSRLRQAAKEAADLRKLAADELKLHAAKAQTHADHYYRYEFTIGAAQVRVTKVEFEFETPKPVTGWTGRYRTTGKAFIEFLETAHYTSNRTTDRFEVLTELKNGELSVVGFTRLP